MKAKLSSLRVRLNLEPLEARSMLTAGALGAGSPLIEGAAGHSATVAAPTAISANSAASVPALNPVDLNLKFSASTVPSNGDVNPYGVAFVPANVAAGGRIHAGDILVSNFNNSSNLQGSGTTIVDINQHGQQSLFFQGPAGLGLTTALGVLQRGFVIVGNLPTIDGTGKTAQQGSLIILDKNGLQVANLSNAALLDGPWDLTIHDQGSRAQVFVSNALSGTVTRLDLSVPGQGNNIYVTSAVQIGSGYMHRTDPAALLLGPTGLAYDATKDVLYVASTADNKIFSISNAGHTNKDGGRGQVVYHDPAHLRGPLALALAPNGDLVTTNGDAVNGDPKHPSEIVEFTPGGKFVSQFSVDPSQGGAFGLALATVNGQLELAAVDDVTNTLNVWVVGPHKKH